MKKSHKIAAGIGIVVILYFGLSALFRPDPNGHNGDKDVQSEADKIPLVSVKHSTAETHETQLEIRGRTEPYRAVVIRAETSGRVTALPVREGRFVRAGQTICGLEVKARQAQLDQARANLRARELEYEAAQRLQVKGYRSENATLAAKANRDAALAGVRAAQAEMANTRVRAPYAGILDSRPVELGDLLTPGQPCGTIVDLNPIEIIGNVTETEAVILKKGQMVKANLTTGERIDGVVTFVARTPDPATKTFRVEITVDNPKGEIPAGVSAMAKVVTGEALAHSIPPAVLSLNSAGQLGLRVLNTSNIVEFHPVTVVADDTEIVWVTGLPESARIIVVGQDYVAEGKEARITVPEPKTPDVEAAE